MSIPERHETATEDRIPWSQLTAYGMGGLINVALVNIVGQLMSLLGNISLGLSAFWLGVILIVPRFCDAIVDPLVGHYSDNTRTRWGRRRPYILFGGILTAISFVAIWWIPRAEWLQARLGTGTAFYVAQFGYILVTMVLFYASTTIFEIPHGALGMEMSTDYHERTRLFSAKSFLGNLFAMGTPWLIALANLQFFGGKGGNLVDGMRFVSILIAAAIIPLTLWWFVTLREPGFAVAREQKKTSVWHDLRATMSNKTFLYLTATVFTLATGFNFVMNFANYITIFYLYGGNLTPASVLMGINGTVWAVTALVAVFPLNWLSRRIGKRWALLVAILLMCAAQLSKIVCYHPGPLFQISLPAWFASEENRVFTVQGPYLVLIPTMLLSAGMLMFFTLGSSMVGDVCDEDELHTGTRSEGSYYAVFWWFLKMGLAVASVVAGSLIVYTTFDQKQNVNVDDLIKDLTLIKADVEEWQATLPPLEPQIAKLNERFDSAIGHLDALRQHFNERVHDYPDQKDHISELIQRTDELRSKTQSLRTNTGNLTSAREQLARNIDELMAATPLLKLQTPKSLFRLRLFEIGVPLALSAVSILFLLRYPLTEARCYEIKELLKQRRAAREETNA